MKQYFFITFLTLQLYAHADYEQIINHHAHAWKKSYGATLDNTAHLQTLIDVILLSYQIAQESCTMMLAKLTMQEELLKIYTPSLNDSWHTNMQVINNDTSILENALDAIKQSQATLQNIFNQLKTVAPRIIQINPQPTQTLISDLKHSLMIWGKQQHEITAQLCCIQQEFSSAIAMISDIKLMFDTMGNTAELKNCHLKEAAGCVSKTTKDIESVFAHVTQVRKISILKIQTFFTKFFQTYYTMLYQLLTTEQKYNFITLATDDKKLPHPDAFFI
ncbi:hypothetical protein A3J41_00110 [candidate division TM6 bacterium RIFCSPHIGHO2_12_FULL_38_8]|nr:MAG: hypothetical protein A3J41_00110 [candidate division TM6 bacterium RIFCSPHIGHO2_12_FULL_38_8]